MTTETFTEADTQTFATKLEAFSQTLTTGEQAILTLIEQQLGTLTTTDTDDVQGYMLDQIDVALARQRELLHEADRLRPAARAGQEKTETQTESRATLWSRIALTLGQQANAMSPRATGQAATG
jgi:hypothetical protein